MTTIPHHNIVIQQGSYVLKVLNAQRSYASAAELADSEQPEKGDRLRSVVQILGEPTRMGPIHGEPFDRSRSPYRGRGTGLYTRGARREKSPGDLLDTFA